MSANELDILWHIQKQLASIYEVDIDYDIRHFTLTDSIVAQAICNDKSQSPEQLFINQQEDCLDISLYLDQSLLEDLHQDNPFKHLHKDNLRSYWIAVEGVSHFLYVAWRANYDRQVSQLELELQAEIDKYVCATNLLEQQTQNICKQTLWAELFKNYYLREHLNIEQIRRYQQANEYAGQYCRRINTLLTRKKDDEAYYKQLRRFYRLSQHAKMAHIADA